MFQLLALVSLATAAPLDDPHLAERAEWINCEAEPHEACEGIHDAFTAGTGFIWLDEDCAQVSASCPQNYVAFAYDAPFAERTACSCVDLDSAVDDGSSWVFTEFGECPATNGGGDDASYAGDCQSLPEALGNVTPLPEACGAGEVKNTRCARMADGCYECWERCVKASEWNGGIVVEGAE